MKFTQSRKPRSKELLLTIDKFDGGSNSLMDEARMPSKFAVESVNMMQVQDSIWKTRWGTAEYGKDLPFDCDGATEFVKSDGSTELIAVAGGHVWKSTDGGTWTEVEEA